VLIARAVTPLEIGKPGSQAFRLVNQSGQTLRANGEARILVRQVYQWLIVFSSTATQTRNP